MRPRKSTHEPSTQDENLARETEKMFAVQICWGCFVAEVVQWLMPTSVAWGESSSHPLLSCRVFDAGQVEGCVVTPLSP